jgi:hypothetical protein
MTVSEHPDFKRYRLVQRFRKSAFVRDVLENELGSQMEALYGTRDAKELEIEQFYALRRALVALPLAPWLIAKIKANEAPPSKEKKGPGKHQ